MSVTPDHIQSTINSLDMLETFLRNPPGEEQYHYYVTGLGVELLTSRDTHARSVLPQVVDCLPDWLEKLEYAKTQLTSVSRGKQLSGYEKERLSKILGDDHRGTDAVVAKALQFYSRIEGALDFQNLKTQSGKPLSESHDFDAFRRTNIKEEEVAPYRGVRQLFDLLPSVRQMVQPAGNDLPGHTQLSETGDDGRNHSLGEVGEAKARAAALVQARSLIEGDDYWNFSEDSAWACLSETAIKGENRKELVTALRNMFENAPPNSGMGITVPTAVLHQTRARMAQDRGENYAGNVAQTMIVREKCYPTSWPRHSSNSNGALFYIDRAQCNIQGLREALTEALGSANVDIAPDMRSIRVEESALREARTRIEEQRRSTEPARDTSRGEGGPSHGLTRSQFSSKGQQTDGVTRRG